MLYAELLKIAKPNVVPVVEKLIQFHNPSADVAFKNIFNEPRDVNKFNPADFIRGLEAFIGLANLNYDERVTVFGTQFGGLHYANDLAVLWNTEHSNNPITGLDLPFLAPNSWECYLEHPRVAYKYSGNQPALALDQFLQGPSVIDCGMFCQLSILFGIRYMLGDDIFNRKGTDVCLVLCYTRTS